VSTVGGLTDQQKLFVDLVRGAGLDEKEAATRAGYKAVPRSAIIAKALAGEDTTQPSDTARRYAADLSIERSSGKPFGTPPRTWLLDRGHELERLARMAYEETNRAFVTEAGICVTDDNLFGYSTDGLVNDDGLIEIKCPIDGNKILTMWSTGDVSDYMHQMQGGMWISGRKWCDFIMYVPDLAPVGKDLFVKRIHRNDNFIDEMVRGLARFQALVDQNVAILRAADQPIYLGEAAQVIHAATEPTPAPEQNLAPTGRVSRFTLGRQQAAE
jgi:exodeoxyribonuclease (lambda-induced)